jgi:hypothetical protein
MAEASNEEEKLTVAEEYEVSRKHLIDLLQNSPDKTITADVDGRIVFRASLRGKDNDTVWVDFMDEYDWMKDDGETQTTVVDQNDRLTAYRVSLSPDDENYLNGKPFVVVKVSEANTFDLEDVDFNDGRVLEPATTASLDRHYYIKKERDLSSAVSFITRILEEKTKK